MYNLCLFDLDGTLTDPKIGITKSVQYALRAFGIEITNLDELTKFIGPPLRDSFRLFYGLSEIEAETAVAKYREYFNVTGMFENVCYVGIIEMLERLKKLDITLAIATSKPTVYAKQIAEHFGFARYFNIIIGSELDGTRSRKSEIIRCALDILDAERSTLPVMIGDREHDTIGACEAGIDSIGVLWGYGSRSELTDGGATYIADSIDELVRLIVSR